MNRILALLLLLASGASLAASVEGVELLRDEGGKPGGAVEMFAPTDHVQHFRVSLDELQLGDHRFVVEFWADETTSGKNQKITEFETSGLIANTITAQVSLPRDWPMGWYRLKVRMDDAEIGSHRYIVSRPWESQTISAWTLRAGDAEGKPGNVVDAFSASDRMQYIEMETDGFIKRGATLRYVYTAVETEAGNGVEVASVEYVIPDDDSVFNMLSSHVSLPNEWPQGKYRLTVMEGERVLGAHDYEVR